MSTIKKDKVVNIHYKLTDKDGTVIDSSEGRSPLAYLHGAKNIVVGLESVLEGQKKGEKLSVIVKPEDGYGLVDERLKQEVEKSKFGEDFTFEVGFMFQVQTENGPAIVRIAEIKDNTIIVDFNHELAGKTLYFDVEIMDVRDATKEELEHGHAHGEGGHQH